MPALLREHQHELLAPGAETGIVFGTEDTGFLTIERPAITGGEMRSTDTDRPGEDGIVFGRDQRGAKTYAFVLGVLTDRLNGFTNPHRDNLDALNRLEGEWMARKWRRTPHDYAVLRSCEAGRVSRCYGRPRRWEETAGRLTVEGYTPVVADFALLDACWYSDTEATADITMAPTSEGGFFAPIVAPITTIASAERDGIMVVGGTRATWPVIEFHGPVSAPSLTLVEDDGSEAWTIGLTGTIGAGVVARIDPRPWQRTVLRVDTGASLAGRLSAVSPRMAEMRVDPGTYTMRFRGSDTTGTARCVVRWRDARSRP